MRQQFLDPAGRLRGQTREYVLDVGVWVVAIELSRLDQAPNGCSPFTRTQETSEQPV